MFKKIATLATVLLITGVGLTLYLPTYQPDNAITVDKISYHIDQPSLKKPLSMDDILLSPVGEDEQRYGLRLGLFGQLQQAIYLAEKTIQSKPATETTIIKATDQQRYWYMVILGPFKTPSQANQQGTLLLQKQQISTTLMRWPLATTKADPAKASQGGSE
ncbi:MAG: hypothetical protein ACI8WB_003315 [Phenylobacterium sp.]|jgi:hypothetical protein